MYMSPPAGLKVDWNVGAINMKPLRGFASRLGVGRRRVFPPRAPPVKRVGVIVDGRPRPVWFILSAHVLNSTHPEP